MKELKAVQKKTQSHNSRCLFTLMAAAYSLISTFFSNSPSPSTAFSRSPNTKSIFSLSRHRVCLHRSPNLTTFALHNHHNHHNHSPQAPLSSALDSLLVLCTSVALSFSLFVADVDSASAFVVTAPRKLQNDELATVRLFQENTPSVVYITNLAARY